MTTSTPAPNPDRAIYGFGLYLVCCLGFLVYVVWAYVPMSYLKAVGLTYWPDKYWALVIPVYVGLPIILVGLCVYPGMNFLATKSLDSIACIRDEHSKPIVATTNPDSIPAIGDIDIKDVCKNLYDCPIRRRKKSVKKSAI